LQLIWALAAWGVEVGLPTAIALTMLNLITAAISMSEMSEIVRANVSNLSKIATSSLFASITPYLCGAEFRQ
jgi:hypothetical protein